MRRSVLKRIVICYDGTWNALTNPDEVTNVVRVAQAVKPAGGAARRRGARGRAQRP